MPATYAQVPFKRVDRPERADNLNLACNPMRSERITALARYVIIDALNPAITAATQWLERTLDDSANKRISVPEAFLATDGILSLYINIVRKGSVYPNVCKKHLSEELPYMATENILMYCVSKGGDRQALHEAIRGHSVAVTKTIKQEGGANNLLELIENDPRFGLSKEELRELVRVENFIGLAPLQTERFIASELDPLLEENQNEPGAEISISV